MLLTDRNDELVQYGKAALESRLILFQFFVFLCICGDQS